MRSRVAAPAFALFGLLLVVASGCSGDADDPDPSPSTTVVSSDPAGSASELPDPPRVEDAVGAIDALELGACETGAGEQTVTGTVTGVAPTTDYLVTVSWTTDDGELRGRGWAVVRGLPPKEKADVTISATVAEGATTCIPGVVYGTVAD